MVVDCLLLYTTPLKALTRARWIVLLSCLLGTSTTFSPVSFVWAHTPMVEFRDLGIHVIGVSDVNKGGMLSY